jgi:hypothetical protein
MIVASDFPRLSRDVIPGLLEWLDRFEIDVEWIKPSVPGAHSRAMLLGKGWLNSIIHVGSADSPDSLKGPNLGWLAVEEATLLPRFIPGRQEPLWVVLFSRLRVPGASNTADLSGTPEGRQCWICDPGRFETAPTDIRQMAAWQRDYRVIRASTGSNVFLPSTYEQDLRNSLDPSQVREKIDGYSSARVGGSAYYAFDRTKNVVRIKYDPLRGEIRVGLDFNINPMSAILAQFHAGKILVFDEISLPDSNTPAMARELIRRLEALHLRPAAVEVYPDASGRARQTCGDSDFNVLRSAGFTRIKSPPANGRVRDRLLAVNGALYHLRLLIDPRCAGLIRDLVNVTVDAAGEIVKTKANLTHLSDALGYPAVRLLPVRRHAA